METYIRFQTPLRCAQTGRPLGIFGSAGRVEESHALPPLFSGGWCDLALLRQRGVDVVVRKHQLRATDFRRGQRLGTDDHLVQYQKPRDPSG